MAANLKEIAGSSILRKQLAAFTGLVMVGFIIAHLAGNLLILAGPEAFNHYAETLASLGEILWLMRFGLIASVLLHIFLTMQLVIENNRARAQQYEVTQDHGDRKIATRAMKYTGILIVLFLFLHLYDFTFGDKEGQSSIVEGLNDGESLGLFGLVWKSFSLQHIWRVFIYILAVFSVGLHLSHAIESLFQTLGINHPRYTPIIRKASLVIGGAVFLGFASLPVYVLIMSIFNAKPFGV
jgi:succinate dehydrogenase / fumarate reductase cytochrome b subunit